MKRFQFQVNSCEVPLDFSLVLDESGAIHSVTPLLYNLPEATQKLILGDKKQLVDRQIVVYSDLLKYMFQLLLNDRLDSKKNTFNHVITYLKSLPDFQPPELPDHWDIIELLIATRGASTFSVSSIIANFVGYDKPT